MGGSLLEGWVEQGFENADLAVVEPNAMVTAKFAAHGILIVESIAALPKDFRPDVVVFAVKPQVMGEVVPSYVELNTIDTAFMSIAAGKTISEFEKSLGASAAIVRAMPNTPAAVGRGVTVVCGNANVTSVQKEFCFKLLGAVGEVEWVKEEGLLDAVTALSGGGPAYVFLLVEVMASAGVASGLPLQLSERLARSTVAGAGELLYQSDELASTLRENVTSPGGTTAEALQVLMANDTLQHLMDHAIAAATARSKELEG
mgnify:CR=1 FL=1